jgi:hypothetical protein
MAKSMKGAGGFSQMPKMMTDEPSVILKLKKGGHVHKKHEHKEEHGHKSMHHMMDGGIMNALAATPRGPMPPMAGVAPKRPAMAIRRKAMAAMPAPMMKKGGKAHHMAKGGEIETKHQQEMENRRFAKIEAELKKHENMPAHLAHKGMAAGGSAAERMKHLAKARAALQKCKEGGGMHHLAKCEEHLAKCSGGSMKKMAKGGATGKAIDEFETKTTIEHDEKPYVQTEMHDGEHHDSVHGTGSVKEGNAGGYKRGGHAHHKHGGKVHHISGHPEGSHEHHKHMAKHHAKMHKEGGSIHHKKMHEHHKAMCAGGKYAIGGTVSQNVATKYENTEMHDGEHHDSAHGTGGVRMSNAGGYKHGGKAHHKHHHKAGGAIDKYETRDTYEGGNWENRPADGTPKGKTNTKTGEVKESNAGGYKRGGHASKKAFADGGYTSIAPVGGYDKDAQAEMNLMKRGGSSKKHYASGGSVNKMGAPKEMLQASKPPSKATHINMLSGVFKKGGHVKKFSGENGSAVTDESRGGYDSVARQETRDNQSMRNFAMKPIEMIKNAMGFGAPPAGSVTKTVKSVTVAPPKKRGGSIKR